MNDLLGQRVYVRELDVFGIVRAIAGDQVTVECDHPMPTYMWTGGRRWLRPASQMER